MPIRFRKSFKVAPGVRMSVSKSGLGASFGTKGARYSMHSSGRRTATVGIPGSGLSYSSSSNVRRRKKTTPQSYAPIPQQAISAKAPGMFSPSGEKAMWNAITKQNSSIEALDIIASAHPKQRMLALTLASIKRSSIKNENEAAIQGLLEVNQNSYDPFKDDFFLRYLTSSTGKVKIADGVTAEMPVSRELIGLVLAELLQDAQRLEEACAVLEALPPSPYLRLSLCELYLWRQESDKVIELSNGLSNEDDVTALTCVYRGVAFRKNDLLDAALLSLKEALRFSSRANEIKNIALIQRSIIHIKNEKKALARKDLERVIADDAKFPGVNKLFEMTRTSSR